MPSLETLVTSIMRLIWLDSKHTQVLLELKSNHRLIDMSSQMVMVSLSWLKVDSSILVVQLAIHHLSCPALSHAKLLPKLNFGKTERPQNMKTVRFTFYQRNLMRRLLCSTCHPLMLNLPYSLKSKLTTLMSSNQVHTSMMPTDTDLIISKKNQFIIFFT